MIGAWARAIGVYRGFLIVSFIPVSLGAALSWASGRCFHWPHFLLTMVSVWFFHAGTNLLNDYYDHISGTDDINEVRTPYSGGTRVIQEAMLPAHQIKIGAVIAFAVGSVLFLVLSTLIGWPILLLAAFGLASGWFYTYKPVWLAYRSFGELMIALNFGPALVITGHYSQSVSFTTDAFLLGMVVGLWAAAIITANEVPDYAADKAVGKRNLVVRFGPHIGLMLWAGMLYAAFGLLTAGIFLGILPRTAVLGLLVLPMAVRLVESARGKIDSLDDIVAICGGTIKSETILWALLMVGLIAGRLVEQYA